MRLRLNLHPFGHVHRKPTGFGVMSIKELEQAVTQLPPEELARFAAWFDAWREQEWEAWDRQIEADVQAGKLDRLIDRAKREHREGRTSPLP